jgi:hypothetical protein
MKPVLETPGANLLTLKSDEPLANFAFEFHLCLYTVERVNVLQRRSGRAGGGAEVAAGARLPVVCGNLCHRRSAGAYTRPRASSP